MLAALVLLAWPQPLRSEQVTVRHLEGLVHGFLVMRTVDGKILARGDLTQAVNSGRVTARMGFRFTDGSSHEETTVFSQQGSFRLLHHRLVQKGRMFERPVDMLVDGRAGLVTVRYLDEDGEVRELALEHMRDYTELSNAFRELAPAAVLRYLEKAGCSVSDQLLSRVLEEQRQESATR